MDTSIKNLKISNMEKSDFVKPFRLHFEMDGKPRVWDCVKVHDSVSILLFHKEKNALLLVKQFRPPVWYHQQQSGFDWNEQGFTHELCAGILDKNLSPKQTAIEEIYEETGYLVKDLEFITSFYSALGFAANRQYLFYGEITEDDKKGLGGGIDGEKIELVYLDVKKAKEFMFNEELIRAPGLMFAFLWFFANKTKIS
ncbi:MAG: NUDIX hydrolase [Campylobacter sp.]|nr:NUDIX hydrolase [Campylobacter sp.]MBQ7270457.1 NUDIX hydrolase [Campylobacter sp.]MBQ7675709.1 NUDIX hydrolase [Campylobacter sp.]MBR0071374.1 NUDIX hydrolase [Campylobacter sp.]